MNRLYTWLRNYFGFSKMESNGFVILIPLIFLTIISPYVYRVHLSQKDISLDFTTMDSLASVLDNNLKMRQKTVKQTSPEFTNFKNTKRGGHQKNMAKEVESEMKVASEDRKTFEPFDLNTADTTALRKVYGIGPVLSNRIVKYRDLLGGFTSKSQLHEVYGLEQEVIDRLDSLTYISEVFVPKQLSINELKYYQLDDHPYLDKKTAKAIDAYRQQHGKFDSLEALYSIHLLDSVEIKKIAPYIKL